MKYFKHADKYREKYNKNSGTHNTTLSNLNSALQMYECVCVCVYVCFKEINLTGALVGSVG